jgi:hypothetical protein
MADSKVISSQPAWKNKIFEDIKQRDTVCIKVFQQLFTSCEFSSISFNKDKIKK